MGCTQLPYAARLVARMDQSHGLLDRMNITIPNCLRPSPDETLIAIHKCKQYPLTSISDSLHELHCTKLPPLFQLDEEAEEYKKSLHREFIDEMNKALIAGEIPPKSKKLDIALRLSVPIHTMLGNNNVITY